MQKRPGFPRPWRTFSSTGFWRGRRGLQARAENLSKTFGDFAAVDGISFRVKDGAIFGFLGANGAGKTTTIRMMCGLLNPTSGSLEVAGVDIRRNPESVRSRIGYMSQLFSLYPDLTVEENLRFFGGIYGMRGAALDDRIGEVLERLEMGGMRARPAASLPLGYKQRLGLGSAALHRPRIIFLDEPTSGVDPVSRIRFWEFIRELAVGGGITVIVSTHFLNEAEYCDRIVLMNQGRIAAEGTPTGLRGGADFRIFESPAKPGPSLIMRAKGIPGVRDAYAWGSALRISAAEDMTLEAAKSGLSGAGIEADGLREVQPSLEDVFMRHYQK
jgi:ABC-2 type transport system ATP-binding protein